MADSCPMGCSTWKALLWIWNCRSTKKQTIWHAIYPLVASPVTCEWQILGQFSSRPHCRPQIRGSRGRHIRHGSWRWVHPQCRDSHAVSRISWSAVADQKYAHPTSIAGSNVTWIDDELESAIGNEHVPDGEYPTGQTCRSLDSLLCRKLSTLWLSFPHLLFQWRGSWTWYLRLGGDPAVRP